jgi:hypothetical protein
MGVVLVQKIDNAICTPPFANGRTHWRFGKGELLSIGGSKPGRLRNEGLFAIGRNVSRFWEETLFSVRRKSY